jgi:ATP-dependent protease ClpP protease subunit
MSATDSHAPAPPVPAALSQAPAIRLYGSVDQSMLAEFLRQRAEAPAEGPIVFELSTSGGDADVGRRIAQEIRAWRGGGAALYFLGKSYVYSAGVTVMAAFARERRFLTADCELLVHERRLSKTLQLDGALHACMVQVKSALAEIVSGQRLERAGFADLVQGSSLSLADLEARVRECDWYVPAAEARELGLVGGIVD